MVTNSFSENELVYKIWLSRMEGVGPVIAKRLLDHFGSAENVYNQSSKKLLLVEGIGEYYANIIKKNRGLDLAEKEIERAKDKGHQAFLYQSEEYPILLSHCSDAPLVLFGKGELHWKNRKLVSIVGTRRASRKGIDFCKEIINQLIPHNPVIVSGLAFGIDIAAHKAAVELGVDTIGVLAHGLDRIYPREHYGTARKMLNKGGWLTEFPEGTTPNRENFPKRNRIVAGISEATIVVESEKTGGSIITADLANSYNREVFAVPGSPGDKFSSGPHSLIKTNRAHLLENAGDIENLLNWNKKNNSAAQVKLPVNLNEEEQRIFDLLKSKDCPVDLDSMVYELGKPVHLLSINLLNMELEGYVSSLPGKRYVIN